MKSVYCAGRTGSLNKAVCVSSLKGLIDPSGTSRIVSCGQTDSHGEATRDSSVCESARIVLKTVLEVD